MKRFEFFFDSSTHNSKYLPRIWEYFYNDNTSSTLVFFVLKSTGKFDTPSAVKRSRFMSEARFSSVWPLSIVALSSRL
jgi:hypothetical protein